VRVKSRVYSGAVCEQEVFTISDHTRDYKNAVYKPRFVSDEERAAHRLGISRRRHAQKVNANFGPKSLYSTLTLDDEHEVHTFKEAGRILTNYIRRLKAVIPEAEIMSYMGRGKGTRRIHYHMLTNHIPQEVLEEKWAAGDVIRIEHLREKVKLADGTYGQDYEGLANYLFSHWSPEQGGRRWRQTNNLKQPEREKATVVKRNYSERKPPRMPKGWRLVEARSNGFGLLYYKYVHCDGSKRPPRRVM